MILTIMQITSLVLLMFLVEKYDKKISSLEEMSESKDKYIALLEKRNREERIYKNNKLNNK